MYFLLYPKQKEGRQYHNTNMTGGKTTIKRETLVLYLTYLLPYTRRRCIGPAPTTFSTKRQEIFRYKVFCIKMLNISFWEFLLKKKKTHLSWLFGGKYFSSRGEVTGPHPLPFWIGRCTDWLLCCFIFRDDPYLGILHIFSQGKGSGKIQQDVEQATKIFKKRPQKQNKQNRQKF